MLGRQKTGSTLCPSCGGLVGVNDESCYHCGRRRPGLWGLSRYLRGGSLESLFVPGIWWTCGALFLATLAADPEGIGMGGLLGMVSPSMESLFRFGASGAVPVFGYGRWWTLLSAGWLHGGIVHILFNMMAVRDLGFAVAHVYGPARAVILYVAAGACGFLASTLAGAFLPFLPGFLRGASFTIGASASVFGLVGALLHYSRRGGSSQLRAAAQRWILIGALFGFMVPGIDNWAHLGGLVAGYLVSAWLDPLMPERGDHLVGAAVCLVLSVAAIVTSVAAGLPRG